jgi:ADP-heptose:LPS heptosyltransferase
MQKPLKILIIRFSSIGDIVLTTPVVRCLKQQLGDVKVHYITKKAFEPIISNNPYIDKAFYLEKDLAGIISELKAEQYDYVIDLHNNLRSLRIKLALNAKSISFDKLNSKKWLLVNLRLNKLPDIHIVERYFNSVKSLDVKNDNKGLDYFIPEKDEININTLPIKTQDYIAFAIGAQHATKRLPTHKIIGICKQINKPIILLGGPGDKSTAEEIKQAVGDTIYNACGIYNLNQSASIVKQAYKVISHDTGLMHIAAAFQKEIIAVWGNTVPEFGMYPYQTKHINVEVKGLDCRPCSKIGYNECPKKHFKCMNLIDEKLIINNCN